MAQHIGCILESEEGALIKNSDLNFAVLQRSLQELDPIKKNYPWLQTIDEYGDTVFNPLQTPIISAELEDFKNHVNSENQHLIDQFLVFIKEIGLHQLIRFTGD